MVKSPYHVIFAGDLYCSCRHDLKMPGRADGLLDVQTDSGRVVGLTCPDCHTVYLIGDGMIHPILERR